jgi:hypothetical protein
VPSQDAAKEAGAGIVFLIDELIARVQRGERLREAEKRHLSLGSRLRVQRAEREIVDRMTPQQRMLAYREGRLSAYQRNHWLCQYPREVPMVDDVPEWIAATQAGGSSDTAP